MKWYWLIPVIILAVLAFGAGYGYHWYNSPLNCPLCLCKSAALPPDYVQYWGEFVAMVQRYALYAGLAVGALIVEGGVIIALLAKRLQQPKIDSFRSKW